MPNNAIGGRMRSQSRAKTVALPRRRRAATYSQFFYWALALAIVGTVGFVAVLLGALPGA
jgi:hypothetical protein